MRGTLLADRIQHLCSEMVAHISATSYMHQRISRMLVNFKTDAEDRVWFLWASSVRVAADGKAGAEGGNEGSSSSGVGLGARAGADPAAPSAARLGGSSSAVDLRSRSRAPTQGLSAVCLNPAMSSPARPPMPKHHRASEPVCPYTGKPLLAHRPYFLTYKTIVEYASLLDARQRVRRPPTEVPPLLQAVCPSLDGERFASEMANPLSLFLFSRVLVSEEAYLEFSTASLPGMKTLPAITGKARQRLLASASAPALPAIPTEPS